MIALLIWLKLLIPGIEINEINSQHDFFEVDHLNYTYTIQDSELTKYDSNGNKLFNYSDQSLGAINSIDVSNPLRILVFYKDFNTILFLDRNLAKIGNEIDLYDFSDNETDLVCSSQNGGFWMYNEIDNQCIQISNTGDILTESMLLSTFFTDQSATDFNEYNGELYFLFMEKGILKLDQNGQYDRKIPLPYITGFKILKNEIFYWNSIGIFRYEQYSKKDVEIYRFNNVTPKSLRILSDRIYLSNEKSISIKKLSF